MAHLAGRSSFSQPSLGIIAHELGHNLNLRHAPCGGAAGPDPEYPYPDGSIGTWGYDFGSDSPVHPSTSELMSYCGPSWISDFTSPVSLRFRLEDEGKAVSATAAASARSLRVWGGIGADSIPYLEPAFVVDAPTALPDSAGDYRITARNSTGGELFSFRFAMPETADGDGSSSFVFALPVHPEREGSLATVTVSGTATPSTARPTSPWPSCVTRPGKCRGIPRLNSTSTLARRALSPHARRAARYEGEGRTPPSATTARSYKRSGAVWTTRDCSPETAYGCAAPPPLPTIRPECGQMIGVLSSMSLIISAISHE